MKEIRRKIPKVDPIPTRQSSQKVSDKESDKQALPFFQMDRDSELVYPVPQLDLTEAYLSSNMTIPIRQCMNSISRKNPIRRTRETKATSHEDSPFPKRKTQWAKSGTQSLSPIIKPGTADSSLETASPPKDEIGKEDYESDDSVALFYQAYYKYKPEIARGSEGFTTPEKQIKHTITNNMQNIDLTSNEEIPLYDQTQRLEPLEVIMDTGAALTMFPGTYRFA
jgi:hypothetical protein